MDRYNFYYLQKVKESELDAAFDAVENAIAAFLEGFQYIGIVYGAAVTEHSPTPNLTVDVEGPALVYDQSAQRIAWNTTQVIDITIDENGSATAVGTSGNEKYLSIFAEFDRNLSDPRTDGFGATVFFDNAESYKINVVQGTEAPTGTATKPALRGDQILLADVLITYSMTQVQNSDIDDSRSQVPFDLTGSPLSIKEKSMQDAMQAMLDTINGYDSDDISSAAISDSPSSLASGSILDQLTQLLGHVNDRGRIASAETWSAKQTFSANPAIRLYPGSLTLAADGDVGISTSGDDSLKVRINGNDRIIAQEPISRTVYIPISLGHPDWDATNSWHEWFAVQGSTNHSWKTQELDGSEFYIKFDINTIVPQGAVVTSVEIYVDPRGVTSGTNGVRLGLFYKAPPPTGTTQIGSYVYDDGSDTTQWITLSGLSTTFYSNQYMYFIQVRSQTLVASSQSNWLHYVRVTFTDGAFARVP